MNVIRLSSRASPLFTSTGTLSLCIITKVIDNSDPPIGHRRTYRPIQPNRRGLTLFEVLLALVIFVGAFTAIGQLLSNGVRGALQSRLKLQAAQLCQAKMGEVVCGAQELKAAQAVFPDDPNWSWSVVVGPAPVPGLVLVQVTVERVSKNQQAGVKFGLTRYVRDPQLYLAAEEEAAAREAEEAAASGDEL